MIRSLLVSLSLLAGASAVPLRVVTFNIEANRGSNGFVTDSLNDPGTMDYDTVRDILARINADVVCLQEIANADISGGTNGGTNSDVHSLATELGLPHVLIPTSSGVFDFTLRNVILSRYPFESTEEVGTADYQDSIGAVGSNGNRARDITRAMPVVEIEVPGAAEPVTIITVHNKSSTGLSDRFRRSVEMARLADYFDRIGLDASDNIILTGDFNLSSTDRTFTEEPNGLPSTWNRGTDIPLPISYSTDVDFYFPAPFNLVAIDARDVNGGDATFQFGGATLDYILPSPAVTVVGSEIYRSDLDTSNNQGLNKVGEPLPFSTSEDAADHWAVFADFELEDLIPPATSYSLTDASPKVIENFDSFDGQAPPEPWSSSNSDWQGLFSNQTAAANYGFDFNGDRSVGVIASRTPYSFSATFDNNTSTTIERLNLSLLARQFTGNNFGTSDTLEASLALPGDSLLTIPELSFNATPQQNPSFESNLNTNVEGLSIAPGSSFTLTLTATQGPDTGGPVSSEVFINEFHYDNSGTDSGEFIEVVVAPGFTFSGGDLAGIEVVFYNGNPTQLSPYATLALSSFDNFSNPTIDNGYQIFTHDFVIQNGPDGIAIVIDGVVSQFISYEGSFTPLEGPATGMPSVDIGVAQSPTFDSGFGSIGLTGAGADSGSMSWTRFGETVAHTPGQANPGQIFTGSAPMPPQAFSFDNVTLCILEPLDSDMDGTPDSSDPDDDNDQLPDTLEEQLGTNPILADSDSNGTLDGDEDSDSDGLSNLEELLITLTDPADQNSLFRVCLKQHPTNPEDLTLIFPTHLGRTYQIFNGQRPDSLNLLSTFSGTGTQSTFSITPDQSGAAFYSVSVSLDEE